MHHHLITHAGLCTWHCQSMLLCITTDHRCRPQYLALSNLCQEFPGVPIIAVTATATAAVIKEIKQILGLKQPKILTGSFNRPNIQYSVRHKELIGDGSEQAVLQVLPGQSQLALPGLISAFPDMCCAVLYCAGLCFVFLLVSALASARLPWNSLTAYTVLEADHS